MGIVVTDSAVGVGAVTRLLRGEREHAGVALRYRSVLVSQHSIDRDAMWRWSEQPDDGSETAAILVAAVPLEVRGIEAVPREVAPGTLVFLHPHRAVSVTAVEAGTVMGAWVPWDTLDEIESGVDALAERIPVSALGSGLHAFLASLLGQSFARTPHTDDLVERLIAEMVFGVLLEAIPQSGVNLARATPDVERARSLILMRRADPEFGVAALARELYMSIRQLQRLFAAAESTPADDLRRSRVELARDLMSRSGHARLGVGEIATHAGFRDAAALRRAFAWAGLPSPLKLRNAHRH
ncbi:AraC family transcriptional regulator [Microbacterium azadirachtae]|uniref:DNA-binding transcriptional activator FeaR n=1 Tax=Microbacterium azadirachtae TaxID=582680 RepID=A0A0F0LGC5_9MICO|nr:AraC family transcriptional regulator [Microbacterium azadirachtae]KJL32272.1 DNA-binding transcriptional activator FeaR [Microbacterium azadirachtae]